MQSAQNASTKTIRRWLLKRARTARIWIGLSIGAGLSSGFLLIVQAHYLALIVHGTLMQKRPLAEMGPFFGILLVVVGLRAALGWAREITGFYAGAGIRQKIRLELLAHIASLGPAYTSSRSTGALTSVAMEHVEGLHDFYAYYLPQLALAAMIPAAILAFVFPHSWAAGGLFLATAPLIPVFMVLVGMGAESISQRHFKALARMSGYFLDVLQGLTTLKLFGRSKGAEKTIAAVSDNYRQRTMAVLRVAFLSAAVLEFFSSISIALTAVYLGMSYLGYFSFGFYGQPLTLASGFFILLLAPDFYLPLRELGTHYHARAEAIGAAEEPCPAATSDSAVQLVKAPFCIQYRDVHLAFDDGRRPALKGISFDLRFGEQVVAVGASGAGKTTILSLLLGFLRPDRGQILVDKTVLTDLNPVDWRRHVAWIGQQPVLFHATIKENILLGNPKASDAQIQLAARNARVLDFARQLPDGLDTLVGERGVGLSRGQAQRVALARAFLKDAPLLLLDEPASGLDAANEALVIQAIKALAQGRTVLMVTHRLTHIRMADRILVLEDGCIVEQGTYADLIAAAGIFRRLVEG